MGQNRRAERTKSGRSAVCFGVLEFWSFEEAGNIGWNQQARKKIVVVVGFLEEVNKCKTPKQGQKIDKGRRGIVVVVGFLRKWRT